ncbi:MULTISPECIES: TRAP transporter substrate-binding protein [Marinovum]|uniref:Tripartite ATP-independent transporter solute receptor, DctP family n=1 Tax=Marinovum algicola TaxID=42444 RepID=A0A975WFM7_9RHOB|nr:MULTISPECIES: TRAP transporter substrate-binding protein [Marinovum]MDD9739200.1 TRAP transporter substrate-binding protein [Marinovum sp. SP66]SEK11825.1 tripartite ATP-independent transporter solute receptor, DctP family [Marinovum algicola]SLN77542.1 2,3-diketo-L-gulonate-binding periplasmic protein YiaO precursor [Marinovum algicola]
MSNTYAFAVAALMTAGIAGAAAAETVIKVGHGANEQYHMHRALLKFEELVEERSGGDFDVQIFPSSQMGPDREMIEGVQTGVLEMAVSPSSFFAGWDPAFAVIELPYMYPSKEVALDVLNGDAGDEMLARLENQGLVGLGWMENGLRHITNNVRPIKTPEDLQGIKLRTMKVPAHVDTFKALGANPTPMNFGEVYSALQQGVIDGQENPVALIDSQRFYEVQKHVSLTGHVFTVYIPVVGEWFWSGLTEDQQSLLREAMTDAAAYQQELVNAEEAGQLQKIRDAGVNVVELDAAARQVFSDQTQEVRATYREEVGAEVFDGWTAAVAAAGTN